MVVVSQAGSLVAPLDLTARSRVATTALKICVFAYVQLGSGGDGGTVGPEGAAGGAGAPLQTSVTYQAFRRMGLGTATYDDRKQARTIGILRDYPGLGEALEASYGMSLRPTVVPAPIPVVSMDFAAAAAAAAAASAATAAEEGAAEAGSAWVPVEGGLPGAGCEGGVAEAGVAAVEGASAAWAPTGMEDGVDNGGGGAAAAAAPA
jgi:hypothetical protein